MPLYNTFQENNSVAAVGKPQFYFMMNRDQDSKFSSLPSAQAQFSIQSAGADPVAFVKNKEIIYRPNWCSPGLSAITTSDEGNVTNVYSLGSKKQFGWLPTPNLDAWQNPAQSNIPQNPIGGVLPGQNDMVPLLNAAAIYNGHIFYIQQDNDPNVPVGKCVCTVEWEFKGGKQLYAQFGEPTSTAKAV